MMQQYNQPVNNRIQGAVAALNGAVVRYYEEKVVLTNATWHDGNMGELRFDIRSLYRCLSDIRVNDVDAAFVWSENDNNNSFNEELQYVHGIARQHFPGQDVFEGMGRVAEYQIPPPALPLVIPQPPPPPQDGPAPPPDGDPRGWAAVALDGVGATLMFSGVYNVCRAGAGAGLAATQVAQGTAEEAVKEAARRIVLQELLKAGVQEIGAGGVVIVANRLRW